MRMVTTLLSCAQLVWVGAGAECLQPLMDVGAALGRGRDRVAYDGSGLERCRNGGRESELRWVGMRVKGVRG